MAFQYKLTDKRGNPKIMLLDGKWETTYKFSTSTEKLIMAEEFCSIINGIGYKTLKIMNNLKDKQNV